MSRGHHDSSTATWTPPRRFDGFELERPLGTGGMGIVYLARDTRLMRPVALKVVAHPERDHHALTRFAIESQALARVQHPNVVAVYRAGVVDHRPYLAQELLVGHRLDEIARPSSWRLVLRWSRDLARAVAATHAHGVIHRDIKPANIMLVAGWRLKLFDFGLAYLLDAPGDTAQAPPTRASYDGIPGTPLYLAPELWEGRPPTVRSDAYAIGLVMYEALAGELPHAHLRGAALAEAARREDLPGLLLARPDVPHAIAELVDRLVARDPAHRPASVAEVRDALDAVDETQVHTDRAWSLDDDLDAMARGALDQRPTETISELETPVPESPSLTRPGRALAVRRAGG
ncbi:MAG: serine/threonine protein kinase [Deltaproteobacteria bacterium]|nr:serine/threonine protein kinase [Deltaproteobacteria bacterium]